MQRLPDYTMVPRFRSCLRSRVVPRFIVRRAPKCRPPLAIGWCDVFDRLNNCVTVGLFKTYARAWAWARWHEEHDARRIQRYRASLGG